MHLKDFHIIKSSNIIAIYASYLSKIIYLLAPHLPPIKKTNLPVSPDYLSGRHVLTANLWICVSHFVILPKSPTFPFQIHKT